MKNWQKKKERERERERRRRKKQRENKTWPKIPKRKGKSKKTGLKIKWYRKIKKQQQSQ